MILIIEQSCIDSSLVYYSKKSGQSKNNHWLFNINYNKYLIPTNGYN